VNINNVLLINEGYSDNLGDQAINNSLQYLLNSYGINNIKFQDFTKNINKVSSIPLNSINDKNNYQKLTLFGFIKRIIPCQIKWLVKNFNRIINVSKNNYDLVIIGGGQLILSNITFPIALFVWVFFLRFFGNKNIVLFSVGSGTKFKFIDKILFNYSLKKINKIYVRDNNSKKILKNEFNIDAELVYDVAFMHNKLKNNSSNKKNLILLGVTSFYVYNRYNDIKISKEEFFESWIKLLNNNKIDLSKVKLFYTTKKDRLSSIEFKKYILNKYSLNLELLETNKKDILIDYLIQSNLIISGRMHALILGLTYGCEIITYPISEKLIEFKKMFGNKRDFNLNDIQNQIDSKIKEIIVKY
jgi:polysaccharide pyruvyl transferase WcaK-like protein